MTLSATDKAVFATLKRIYRELRLIKFYSSGSTARVYHVQMPIGPAVPHFVDRVIKVFRHDSASFDLTDVDVVFDNEVRHMLAISHSNVLGLYFAGYLTVNRTKVPYFVTEYIPGAKDIDEWIREHSAGMTSDRFIDLLLQITTGIAALHSNKVYHCDLKFGNLLVGDSGLVKIADLGFSKDVKGAGKSLTGMLTTFAPFPKNYSKYITEIPDKRRMHVEIPRTRLTSQFDLHYFGNVISQLLDIPAVRRRLDGLDMSSLQLMAERMNLDTDKPRLSRYANAVQVLADLRKLQRLSLGRPGLPELGTYTGTKTLRIPVTGSIPFTNRLKEIGSHPIFRRLQHAVQLGLTYYVFPGATHTRLEHSYGVFANVARYINSLLSDDYQPYFRQVADEQKVATTLVAGLLHDLGQSSFAHVLEDVGLIDGHEKLSAAFLVGDKTDAYLRDPYRSDTTMADILRRHWPEVDLRRLEWMINPGPGLPFDPGWDIMRNIISGPLDADKTDYLLRDALHAGVEYPRSIDMARFMNSLTASVIREGDRNRGVLAITWKGAQPAEMITLARTQMFWVLYWHHTVRAAHAMLAHATHHHMTACNKREQRALIQSLFCASIDELLAQLCASTSRRASDLARNLRVRQLYKRGFSLEYNEDSAIYMGLMDKKEACDRAKDPLLRTLSAKLAVMMTKTLRDNGRRTQIRTDQVIVDIPKRGKDALPPIYILSKAQGGPETYLSKGIIGSNEEWENRARMVSVFLAPEIAAEDRAQLQQSKMMLLNSI